MKKVLFLISMLCCISANAQVEEEQKEVPLQISFITPLGTNGLESFEKTNNISINIFAGYAKGLNGLEFGGFANILSHNMRGVQAAGMVNLTLRNAKGIQASGIANYCGNNFEKGVQASGFVNAIGGKSQAFQFAGIANLSLKEQTGAQFAGIANYSTNITGAQMSGMVNVCDSIEGIQVSSILNAALSNVDGGQITAIANLGNQVYGTQLSGILNFADSIRGNQIGLFNYANHMENGIPIGLFSYVQNGFRAFEVSTNESFYGAFSFKSGHSKFYNIVSLGSSIKDDKILWGFGYGVGTSFEFNSKWGLQAEGIVYHLNEDELFTDEINQLTKLNVLGSYTLNQNVSFFAGPSLNILVTHDPLYEVQDRTLPTIAPGAFFDKNYGDERVVMYPGFSMGIRF